jgi:uncharacterized OB-fold protein
MKSATVEHASREPAWLPGGSAQLSAEGTLVLIAGRCRVCSARMFPKRAICCACMSEDIGDEEQATTGTLYSFTQVHVGPPQWSKPMTVGFVDLSSGLRVFAHLRPTPGLAIGAAVSLTSGQVGTAGDGTPINSFMFQAAE